MNGLKRLILLFLAFLLRCVARVPLWTGKRMASWANDLERLADGRPLNGRFVP